MNTQFIKLIATIIIVVSFTSCAITPNIQAPRPWTRTLGQSESIETGTSIYIDVSGDEDHLLLDNSLMDKSVYAVVKEQLNRRNFKIHKNKSSADYVLFVDYQSKEEKIVQTEISSFQSSYQESASTSGYGVLAALAVAEQASSSQSRSQVAVAEQTAYKHTLGFSIHQNDEMVWTGESTWKSSNVDISNRMTSVTQLLLSNLPGYGERTPRVKAVNPEKRNNYFKLFISGNSFVGPSLPYMINFKPLKSVIRTEEPEIKGISNPRILHAVVDLIQTAEFALPTDPDYENPIDIGQWAKVKLGSEYYIGDDKQKTHIIIELTGDKRGYNISNASKVNRQEYSSFLNDLKKWQTALTNYYSVFE